jgi:hypothetical protein
MGTYGFPVANFPERLKLPKHVHNIRNPYFVPKGTFWIVGNENNYQ